MKLIDHLDSNDKEIIRNKITNILTNFKNKINNSHKTGKNKINYFLKEAKSFLNQKSLYVLTADKSKKTVIMEKKEYNKKMTDLLNDSLTYKKETKDLTKNIQTKINNLINK